MTLLKRRFSKNFLKYFFGFLFALLLLFVSLIGINESGYESLSPDEKARVKVCDRPMSEIVYDNQVYQVTVEQVRAYMKDIPDLIVYEYLPFCGAPSCVPPIHAHKFCKKKGLSVCVISSTYDGLFQLQQKTLPLFVINHTVYGTDNYQKYSEQFYNALTGTTPEEREFHAYHYFKNGYYVCSYGSLESIHKQ